MANKFTGFDEEEEDVLAPKEPQVTSHDPEERKAARTLRIKRRQDAIKRAEQPIEEAVAEEEPGPIEEATATAAEELQRLSLDGAAMVTNVKVTTDEREVIRRELLSERMRISMQKIEDEAAEAQLQYEAITSNWGTMLQIKDPLDIDVAIKLQRQNCDELLEMKNQLIDHLKADLRHMDTEYYEDLEKQDTDVKELSERIEKQIHIMQKAYEKQLALIDFAISLERDAMVDHNNKRWEALYKQRDREEVSHMEYKFQQLAENKTEIEAIMWDHHEKYREAKIELESLIQELQKELEKLKATCIINTEKIGYIYQVLKKREEENIFVRSEQKRKLNKMSDVANSLRAKIRKAAEDGAQEEIRADAEIVKLMQAMDDLEKKCLHFSHVNNYKFNQVWRMSALRCSELTREVRRAEVALHAHILAEPPPPGPTAPPKSPLLNDFEEEAKKTASAVTSEEAEDPKNMVAMHAKDKLVGHILELVADNTGFLVEDRLLKLIEKCQTDSKNLCTLDSIFMALQIQSQEDIELLCKTFLNYAFCPICVGVDVTEVIEPFSGVSQDESSHHASLTLRGVRAAGERSSLRTRTSLPRSISASTSRSIHVGFSRGQDLSPADQLLVAEADEIIQKCGDQAESSVGGGSSSDGAAATRRGVRGVTVSAQPTTLVAAPSTSPYMCPVGHHLEIDPMQVLTALGEFISVFMPPEKKKLCDLLLKPPDFSSPSRKMKAEVIESYWSQWKNVFPKEKDRFWDGLLAGLNNYLTILQDRERIHDEVVLLRRRNAALRRLVRGALPELPQVRTQVSLQPKVSAFAAPIPDMAPSRLPPI